MTAQDLISNITGAVVVALLAALLHTLLRLTRTVRRFLVEHSWLLATGRWSRDMILRMAAQMNMPVDDPPDPLPMWKARPPSEH